MTDIVLFHHVLGVTTGFRAFADRLAARGRTVHTPDLFAGRTFSSLEEGIAFSNSIGHDGLAERGLAALAEVPGDLVVGGTSMGAMVAAAAVRVHDRARGMLSFESFIDPQWIGGWDRPVPLQIHGMADDEFFDEDLPAARDWVAGHAEAELFVYPGRDHLFTDSSTAAYDEETTGEVVARAIAFVERQAASTP